MASESAKLPEQNKFKEQRLYVGKSNKKMF